MVLLSQRARLMEAVVFEVAEKGFVATRVADITSRARVSRTTFYEQFADKEACFLAAYELGANVHYMHVAGAIRGTRGAVAQMFEAVRAYLEPLAGEPRYARSFLIEVHAAGLEALATRLAFHRRFALLLRDWRAGAQVELGGLAELPDEVFVATIATGDEIVATRLRETGAVDLMGLAPVITYTHLSLMGLPDGAREALDDGDLAEG